MVVCNKEWKELLRPLNQRTQTGKLVTNGRRLAGDGVYVMAQKFGSGVKL